MTVDFPLIKPLPFTVRVKAGSPALFDAGRILVVVGVAVLPKLLVASATVHREKSLMPVTLIVFETVLTVPPRLFHVIPLSCDL